MIYFKNLTDFIIASTVWFFVIVVCCFRNLTKKVKEAENGYFFTIATWNLMAF